VRWKESRETRWFSRIFAGWLGAKSSFHLSFCSGPCAEDGRGDLRFAAGYGVRRSWLKPSWLWGEREEQVRPSLHHFYAFFSLFFLLQSSKP
jgi:hypothetical protein